ncbi:hypothetical protein BV25DRAFT_1913510 [Artomyces pyxidatus]|uniref:Uncharacterized protein n=1 Tax=Artomyces pyxidatus TaxID=48021 RepID=A0ACB8TBR7_9AGAM|nr:hypothetical protein BV25DRAFT_1913510 [Artomyces pyxidatus]
MSSLQNHSLTERTSYERLSPHLYLPDSNLHGKEGATYIPDVAVEGSFEWPSVNRDSFLESYDIPDNLFSKTVDTLPAQLQDRTHSAQEAESWHAADLSTSDQPLPGSSSFPCDQRLSLTEDPGFTHPPHGIKSLPTPSTAYPTVPHEVFHAADLAEDYAAFQASNSSAVDAGPVRSQSTSDLILSGQGPYPEENLTSYASLLGLPAFSAGDHTPPTYVDHGSSYTVSSDGPSHHLPEQDPARPTSRQPTRASHRHTPSPDDSTASVMQGRLLQDMFSVELPSTGHPPFRVMAGQNNPQAIKRIVKTSTAEDLTENRKRSSIGGDSKALSASLGGSSSLVNDVPPSPQRQLKIGPASLDEAITLALGKRRTTLGVEASSSDSTQRPAKRTKGVGLLAADSPTVLSTPALQVAGIQTPVPEGSWVHDPPSRPSSFTADTWVDKSLLTTESERPSYPRPPMSATALGKRRRLDDSESSPDESSSYQRPVGTMKSKRSRILSTPPSDRNASRAGQVPPRFESIQPPTHIGNAMSNGVTAANTGTYNSIVREIRKSLHTSKPWFTFFLSLWSKVLTSKP